MQQQPYLLVLAHHPIAAKADEYRDVFVVFSLCCMRIMLHPSPAHAPISIMIVPQLEDFYSFKYQILPPLYLTESGIIRSIAEDEGKELISVVELSDTKCKPAGLSIADDSATVATSCSSVSSSSSLAEEEESTSSSTLPDESVDSDDSQSRRKGVAFLQDEAGQMIVTQQVASVEEITPEDCEILWYKSSEFKYFRKYCKKLATIAAASKYGKDFAKTYKACAKTESVDMEKYSKIANSAARGMEAMVSTQMVKDRKDAIRSVLKAQSKLPADMTDHERAIILSATSRVLSRHARILARILGTGDANVAKASNEESSCE